MPSTVLPSLKRMLPVIAPAPDAPVVTVAVKVMHREMSEQADQLERFRQEARAVAKLSHPNVVAVIDAGEDGGHPYIVFEYVEGETLKQRINRVGALDAQEALAYAIEVARGLTVAHARYTWEGQLDVLLAEYGRLTGRPW